MIAYPARSASWAMTRRTLVRLTRSERSESRRMSGRPVSEIEAEYEGRGYGDLKKHLAEVVVEGLAPVRDRAHELLDHPAELDDLLEAGARRANDTARPVLESAWAKLGLD